MGIRHVTGLLRVGGRAASILIEFNGMLDRGCLEAFKLEIENLARASGLKVKRFKLGNRVIKKKAKKKKK